MPTKTTERYYLLGGEPRERFRFRSIFLVSKQREISEALTQAPRQPSVWIATKPDATDDLLREAVRGRPKATKPRLGRLLLLFPPRLDVLPALEEFFHPIAWGTSAFKLLPYDELAEVLSAENRSDLFIAGFVNCKMDLLILYRGNLERLAVPLSLFHRPGEGSKPDPDRLAITDHGQTVRLGKYEAASDAILYELDRDFRRQINDQRRDADRSFGASLRRLRVLKGLRQSDFTPVPAKTIARIERGEVERPHRDTLDRIAKRLGVEPGDIKTY